MKSKKTPALVKEAGECFMKALECYGFVLLDKKATAVQSAKAAANLPIEIAIIPTTVRFREPVIDMLQIASTLGSRDSADAKRWLMAALWVTNRMLGGGKSLFIQMFEPVLDALKLKKLAEKSL